MKFPSLSVLGGSLVMLTAACSGSEGHPTPAGGGGSTGSGGASSSGGAQGSGGATTSSGGATGSGGASSGGALGSGGATTSSGGAPGSGGSSAGTSGSTGGSGAAGTGGGGRGGAGVVVGSGGAGGAPGSGGACTRDVLKSTIDAYFTALAAHSAATLPLGDTVKATENGKTITVGADGLWKTAGTVKYARSALDTTGCNTASEAVVPEGGMDLPVALRLKLVNQKITEIETIAVRPGDYSALKSDTAAIIASDTTIKWEDPIPANMRNTSDEMNAWMAKYFKLFPQGVCDTVASCKRLENGGGNFDCALQAGCASATGSSAPVIKSHAIFSDVETGIGVGFDLFMGNADMHMVKMYGGKVYTVHAVLGKATSTGWTDQ